MLIRLASDELVEYPDELGALVLADPRDGEVPDFSLEELNCFISGALGMLFDESLSLEQNIAEATAHYTRWGSPSSANLEKARTLIQYYTKNIAPKDIGYSDRELVNYVYGIDSAKNANRHIIIEQPPKFDAQSPLLAESNSLDKDA